MSERNEIVFSSEAQLDCLKEYPHKSEKKSASNKLPAALVIILFGMYFEPPPEEIMRCFGLSLNTKSDKLLLSLLKMLLCISIEKVMKQIVNW